MATSDGERLRCGIVGVGAGVFSLHRPAIADSPLQVVGVADVNPDVGQARATELGCPFFDDHRRLIEATRPQLVIVLTPHPFHAPIAINALQAGAHVLVEKPLAVEVAAADAMLEAATRAGRLLAVNFQHRTRPEIRAAAQLIGDGRLGTLQRVELTAIWTRTRRYYALAGWRGTWRGEGGGVLMNQSPHSLDLVCHLAGPPARVVAWTRTLYHAIETEDTAIALLEWSNGALGSLLVSTAQAGEPERLAIAGTRGTLELRGGRLRVLAADTDLRTFLADSDNPYGRLDLHPLEVPSEPGGGDHRAIYANLVAAIADGAPLVASAVSARQSLELANAITYASQTGHQVELPLDRAAYSALLDRLRTTA